LIKPLPPWGLKGEFDFATALGFQVVNIDVNVNLVIYYRYLLG
jgi:hypothetical protein